MVMLSQATTEPLSLGCNIVIYDFTYIKSIKGYRFDYSEHLMLIVADGVRHIKIDLAVRD